MEKENQIAVVTGAAGGFGRAIVRFLLKAGFRVAATDITTDGLKELEEAESNNNLSLHLMDVTNSESIGKVAEELSSHDIKKVSILVNNAGIFMRNPILFPDSISTAEKVSGINMMGLFECTSIFARIMAKQRFGRIINIASIAGLWGTAKASAYAAAKAGVIAATKSWARELGPLGITVTAIAPGICKTNMLEKNEKLSFVEQKIVSLIPVGRYGAPEDIAEVVEFLASCRTNYLNGSIIALDGGLHIGTIDEGTI